MKFPCLAQEKEQAQRNNGSRQDNLKILAEFITHIAALGFHSSDSGIRNNGKIVAEHSATNYCTGTNSHGKACFFANARCNRSQGGNGAHGGAHGNRNKAANNKKASHSHAAR